MTRSDWGLALLFVGSLAGAGATTLAIRQSPAPNTMVTLDSNGYLNVAATGAGVGQGTPSPFGNTLIKVDSNYNLLINCKLGCGGAGSGPTRLALTTDRTNAVSGSFADITGLTTALAATTNYSFSCALVWDVGTTGKLAYFSVNGPTFSLLRYSHQTLTGGGGNPTWFAETAYDQKRNGLSGTVGISNSAQLSGTITTTAAGTLAFRFQPDASDTLTVRAGSFCLVYQ